MQRRGKERPDGGESRLLTESEMRPVWWSRERGREEQRVGFG